MAGIAAAAGAGGGTGAVAPTSLHTVAGASVGALFVTVALVAILIYLNLVEVDEGADERAQHLAVALTLPLLITFVAIIVYESVTIL